MFSCEFCEISKNTFSTEIGPRDKPDTTYFLPNLYDWHSYAIEVDKIEIEEFYLCFTVALSYNSSEFKSGQVALIKITQIIM